MQLWNETAAASLDTSSSLEILFIFRLDFNYIISYIEANLAPPTKFSLLQLSTRRFPTMSHMMQRTSLRTTYIYSKFNCASH